LERRFRVFRRQRRPNTGNEILASQHFGDYSMKRTQIALAAVALVASTAALAQVTVYGTVDGGIANTSFSGVGGGAGTGTGTYLSGAGGYSAGNNIGFKGSEDLGGGLSVNFTLQTGFSLGSGRPDNGGAGSTFTTDTTAASTTNPVVGNQSLFNQVSTIGLSGEFGSVNLGQQLSPFIATAAGGHLGNGHFWVNRLIAGGAAAYPGLATNFPYGGFFVPNAVSYSLPAGLPVSGTFLTTTRAGTGGSNPPNGTAGQVAEDGYTAFNLGSSVGSINLGFAHESRSRSFKNYIVTAGTNIGELQLVGTYMNVKLDPLVLSPVNSFASMSVGAGYNVTPEFNASVQWARNGDTLNGATPSLTALTGKYTLSKRTSLYASYIRASDGAQSNYDLRGNGVAPAITGAGLGGSNSTAVAGIAHSF
jgi:predicted porin